jgi:hypothetical protein
MVSDEKKWTTVSIEVHAFRTSRYLLNTVDVNNQDARPCVGVQRSLLLYNNNLCSDITHSFSSWRVKTCRRLASPFSDLS